MSAPRGIRNHNPGNIRWGSPWQGLVPDDQRTDKDFCQFISAPWGIRALVITLITYRDTHGLDTIWQIIRRWAPEAENDTTDYIADVCERTGFAPHQRIDVTQHDTAAAMVRAITWHENGEQPYSAAVIDEGLRRAGVLSARAAIRTPVGAGTATAGATGIIAAAVTGYQRAQPLLSAAQQVAAGTGSAGDAGRLAVAALVLLSIAGALYAYWHYHREVSS